MFARIRNEGIFGIIDEMNDLMKPNTEQLLGLKPCNGYFTAFSSSLVCKGILKFGFEVVFTLPRINSWNMFLTDALDLNVCKAERVKSFFCEVTTPPVRN